MLKIVYNIKDIFLLKNILYSVLWGDTVPGSVQKRRDFIINLLYISIVVGLVFIFFKYLFWTVSPFLISLLLAASLQKPIRAIERKTKWNHTFVSSLMVIGLLLIIIGPLAAIVGKVIDEIIKFAQYIGNNLDDFPTFVDNIRNGLLKGIQFLPDNIYRGLEEAILRIAENLKGDIDFSSLELNMNKIMTSVGSAVGGIYSVAKNVPDVLLGLVIGIISMFFMTKDYHRLTGFVTRQMPENKKNLLPEVKNVFFNTVGKMFRSYCIIMCITFAEVFIGLSLLNLFKVMQNEYVLVISIGIAIFDILPVLGAGGILIPWALYGLVTGDVKLAIGLIIIYLFIIGFRQYLEPKIIGNQLGVHPLVTLAGLYFGLKMFGFIGIFVVPMFIVTLKALNDTGRIKIWKSAPPKEQTEAHKPKESKLKNLIQKFSHTKKK